MSTVTRPEVTLSLCCLLVAACGGGLPDGPMEQADTSSTSTGTSTTKPMTTGGAGRKASPGIMRATAKIAPLMLSTDGSNAAAAGAAATATGSAGASASAAGSGAAGAVATSSGSAGASSSSTGTAGNKASAGSGGSKTGSAGTRSFASDSNVYAAGSGGSSGSAGTTGASSAAGKGGSTAAAGTPASSSGAAGVSASTAGSPATTATATAGAGGMLAPASITGTATFSSSSSGVNLTVMVSGCNSGKEYPMHIHTGTSCESVASQMGHWDMTRGEGIPSIKCGGKQGATMTMRTTADMATAWSVGDGSATDVIGHVVVIHDADDPTQRIACGQILKN
jgi:hypothetical protein